MRASHLPQQLRRRPWIGYGASVGAVLLVSVVIALILARIAIPNISMLYLIAVLATAAAFGIGPALLASVCAFLVFNWFFIEPKHTFSIHEPSEWLALLLFLLTATITGGLAAGQRRRAHQAAQREREAVVLYDVLRLTMEPDLNQALETVAERLRQELQLEAVAVEVADSRLSARAVAGDRAALPGIEGTSRLSQEVLSEGTPPTGLRRGSPGRWIRVVPPHRPRGAESAARGDLHVVPVKSRGEQIGTLLLAHGSGAPEFDPADDRLLSAVATQLGLAVERRSLRREATEAEILRRTDELKTALLNAVSHDLRTPLASIMASGDSLLQKDVAWTEEDKDEFARAIVRETRRLNRIVGNLLDMSRIDAGALRPQMDWYPLRSLVDDVVGRLRPITSQYQVVVEVDRDLPPVPLDYVEIDQVLSNLVENATKYSPPGIEIRVSARREGDSARVEVADRGPGIPAAKMADLFKPFHRLEGAGPRPKGTGLGLAVARGLVGAHGGRIWAENRPGGGAKFVFTLPLAPHRNMVEGPQERIA